MAFMGMFLVAVAIIIGVVVLFTILGIVLLRISVSKHRKWKIQPGKRKSYLVFRVFGIICMLPLIISAIMIPYNLIKWKADENNSLSYHVMQGNVKEVKRLLESGVSPDCTLDDNEPAEPGEQTLLSVLCEKGFTNTMGNPLDHEETEEELEMIQLLIDYGADIESTTYEHEEGDTLHEYQEECDYYMPSDRCGYTPLLFAIYGRRTETVKLLVKNGADINVKDFCGFNAVATVADNLPDEYGVEILDYLLKKGCDTDVVTKFGQKIDFLVSRHSNSFKNEEIQEMLGYR